MDGFNLRQLSVSQLTATLLIASALIALIWRHNYGIILPYETFSTKVSLSEACANLGTPTSVFVSNSYEPVGKLNAHNFQFPSPLDNFLLCVPSKNGNRNWGGLFYKLRYGDVPDNNTVVSDSIHSLQREEVDRWKDHLWMLTRSPYARMLSTYLDKIWSDDYAHTKHSYPGFFNVFARRNVTFEEFVERTLEEVLGGKPREQVAPIDRGKALCYMNHHLCLQSACLLKTIGDPVRVLHLEQQSEWFPQFVKCFGIEEEDIIGDEWAKFSYNPCFYTPTDSCEDSLKPQRRLFSAVRTNSTSASVSLSPASTSCTGSRFRRLSTLGRGEGGSTLTVSVAASNGDHDRNGGGGTSDSIDTGTITPHAFVSNADSRATKRDCAGAGGTTGSSDSGFNSNEGESSSAKERKTGVGTPERDYYDNNYSSDIKKNARNQEKHHQKQEQQSRRRLIHAKGAASRLGEFYTSKAVEMVEYLYEYDFNVLNIEKWDTSVNLLGR